jgi:hypothetical protein
MDSHPMKKETQSKGLQWSAIIEYLTPPFRKKLEEGTA